jgi:hypothetical protein
VHPPLGEVRQVTRCRRDIVVVVQHHESADGRTSAEQQIYAGQRSMRR